MCQDSWKVTRKLTLDLGLRYDFGPITRNSTAALPISRQTWLTLRREDIQEPLSIRPPAIATLQITIRGDSDRASALRIRSLSRTVLRGGFGIAYTGTGVAQVFSGASGDGCRPIIISRRPPIPVRRSWCWDRA